MLSIVNLLSEYAVAQILRLALQCSRLRALCIDISKIYDHTGDAASDLQTFFTAIGAARLLQEKGQNPEPVPSNISSFRLSNWRETHFASIAALPFDLQSMTSFDLDTDGDRAFQSFQGLIGRLPNVRSMRLKVDNVDRYAPFLEALLSLEKLSIESTSRSEAISARIYRLVKRFQETLKVFSLREESLRSRYASSTTVEHISKLFSGIKDSRLEHLGLQSHLVSRVFRFTFNSN